jgi:hypothetical protein
MKAVTGSLFKRIDGKAIERDVEEELRFHLESLTEELQQDMSLAEAKNAALKRFGDVQQIKDECVEISTNSHPLMRALKSFLIALFLLGVLVRVYGTTIQVVRVGDILIVIAILSRLFLYVRGLNPSSFRSKSEASLSLKLNDRAQGLISNGRHGSLSPVERVIADK